MIERASRAEDVLITVRGKVKARLTKADPSDQVPMGEQWARELRSLQRLTARRRKPRLLTQEILAQDREERF